MKGHNPICERGKEEYPSISMRSYAEKPLISTACIKDQHVFAHFIPLASQQFM